MTSTQLITEKIVYQNGFFSIFRRFIVIPLLVSPRKDSGKKEELNNNNKLNFQYFSHSMIPFYSFSYWKFDIEAKGRFQAFHTRGIARPACQESVLKKKMAKTVIVLYIIVRQGSRYAFLLILGVEPLWRFLMLITFYTTWKSKALSLEIMQVTSTSRDVTISRLSTVNIFLIFTGDGGGAGDGDPIVGGNSEKKVGYETNLYLYDVSTKMLQN